MRVAGLRGHLRAAGAASLIVSLAAASSPASAQDPPPPAEPPEAAPRQDPEGVSALRRLADLVPTPFASGVREISCAATLLGDGPFSVRGRVVWSAGKQPKVRFDVPAPLLAPGAADRLRSQCQGLVSLPFFTWAAMDPAQWSDDEVGSESAGEDRVVTVREASSKGTARFTLAPDGLPREYRLIPKGSEPGPEDRRILPRFARHGGAHALAGIEIILPGAAPSAIEISRYEHVFEFGLPRRIERHRPDGNTDAFLLHDYRFDGAPVDGTSPDEARAGRPRLADHGARRAYSRWDAAVTGHEAGGLAAVSCRLEFRTPQSTRRYRISWAHGAVDRCEPEPGSDGKPETAPEAWGAATVIAAAVYDHLLPPSRQFPGYDASTTGRELILAALHEVAPVQRMRIRIDVAGLPVEAAQEYGDEGPPSTLRWEWAPFREKHVLVGDTVDRGDRRMATRIEWHDVPGFPPLRKSVVRTVTGGDAPGVYVQTFTDWVLDGRPVPGTESAPATAPQPAPDAPK